MTGPARSVRHFAKAALALGLLIPAFSAQAAPCSVSETAALYAYEGSTQQILDVEAAMARAQAAENYIPAGAAAEISRRASVQFVPQDRFEAERERVGHRMVALLNVWRETLNDEGDRYVHFGATTVDIYGTATILQTERAIDQLDRCLERNIAAMAQLARNHDRTAMIGRTLGQHAQPITFGKKVTTWIDEYRRHRERLAQLRQRVRKSAILKGAVGNYSGLGDDAIAIEQNFARELGLDPPYAADWNGTRDVLAEYGLVLGLIAKSGQRIGQEIFLLQGTDIGEVREALPAGTVGSSSMPHKSNPRAPGRLVHAGRTIPRLGEALADDVVNFFERDTTAHTASTLEQISVESMRGLRNLATLLEGLEVDAAQMKRNIDRTQGFAMSQRIAFALAQSMPRVSAEKLVKQVISRAREDGLTFAQALQADEQVGKHLDRRRIDALLSPDTVETPAIEQVRRVLLPGDDPGAEK